MEEKEKKQRKKPLEEFVHKINMDNLVKELDLKCVEDVGAFVGLKNPKGAYYWAKDKADAGTRPSYNALIKMLNQGASVETLFGVEYKKMHQEFIVSPSTQEIFDSPEFQAGMKKAIEKLKKDGLI